MREVRPIPESVPEICDNCGAKAPTVLDENGLAVCSVCGWREGAW